MPPTGGAGISTFTEPPAPPPQQNPNALADSLRLRGWIYPVPPAANLLDGGDFGLRNTLAEAGISYFGFTSTTYEDNILRHGLPPGVNSALAGNSKQEQYDGQLPTFNSSNAFFVNYDLRRYGIPNGQITLGGAVVSNNWNPSGPNAVSLAQANFYSTMFNGRVEVNIGYLENVLEFLGTQVGGNLSSGIFGVGAAINVENGENIPALPTPGINVKVNLPDHFYTKLGVQRASSPDDPVVERLQNPSGVRFLTPNSGVFVIDEAGYRVPPTPGHMGTWIRGAVDYSTSRYNLLSSAVEDRHTGDFGLYLLADRELIQLRPNAGPGAAVQGIYAGFSVNYGPSYFNAFAQYYEARLYSFGLIPGRPYDQVSLVANRNIFSKNAITLAQSFGLMTHAAADTFTAAYSAHVLPGTNINIGLGYTDNPSPIVYNTHTGSALNVLTNLFVFF